MNCSVAQHFLSLRDILCHHKLSDYHFQRLLADVKQLAQVAAVKVEGGFIFHDGSKLVCGPDGWEATPMSEAFVRESLVPLAGELRQFADGQEDYIADLCERAAEGLEGRLQVLLVDQIDCDDQPSKLCRITADASGIYIRPEGYGDYCSRDGDGVPVIIEFARGDMRVLIWDDINAEEPTHIISLEGAREDAREEDDNQDNPGG